MTPTNTQDSGNPGWMDAAGEMIATGERVIETKFPDSRYAARVGVERCKVQLALPVAVRLCVDGGRVDLRRDVGREFAWPG